jgi:hypothetical protein
VRERLGTAPKLSDEDRAVIIAIARKALTPFQPAAAPTPQAGPEQAAAVASKS